MIYKLKFNIVFLVVLSSMFLLVSCTNKKSYSLINLAESKTTTLELYVTAVEAFDMIKNDGDILFLDVRTRAELAFLGMPAMADINIPYMLVGDWDEWNNKKNTFKIYPNSNFLPYFKDYMQENVFDKNKKVIIICRSGNRSAKAVNLLAKVGYTNVYTVVDGFEGYNNNNGWKHNGLPWSNKLDKNKMYMDGF